MKGSLLSVGVALSAIGFAAAGRNSTSSNSTLPELPPIPRDLSTPVQQRLAFRGPTAMAVGWNTFKKLKSLKVYYGLWPDALWLTAEASPESSVTYPTSRTWSNTVILEGLLPATTYYYKIESTNSTVDTFKTGVVAGDHRPFSTALVIDLGVQGQYGVTESKRSLGRRITTKPAQSHGTIDRLVQMKDSYDFVIHPGDLDYADEWIDAESLGVDPGSLSDGVQVFEGLTELFYDQLAAVSKIKPYFVGPGNHEANCNEDGDHQYLCPPGQLNFTGYINRWGPILPTSPPSPYSSLSPYKRSLQPRSPSLLPSSQKRSADYSNGYGGGYGNAASLAQPPFWYSFDYGMAHFIFFNTETDFGSTVKGPEDIGGSSGLNDGPFATKGIDQQIEFIKKDLASVDRSVTPWVVAAGHRPWYTAGSNCTDCATVFEPLLLEGGVDIAVFGHVHNMQRINPIANGVPDPAGLNNPKAPLYIINGASGNVEGLAAASPLPSYVSFVNDTLYGFSLLNFKDKNHLEVQFISSHDGSVLDSSTLYKKH